MFECYNIHYLDLIQHANALSSVDETRMFKYYLPSMCRAACDLEVAVPIRTGSANSGLNMLHSVDLKLCRFRASQFITL